ncbi:ABC-F type ribosomal protection protein [Bacillus mangrovi]|uniref:ABC-F type ribosomal protection protein n=1 Tax=Metabacillus mangrovi TaxID=1491830 RepID=A0A7X2S4Y0_9BACI|nr:ABC-F type ribosomal protection protein [Metabacillus mangrovi]MTH53467.1 ABC-F type ribosomal protection protein [Metabacillus mangrovi]
MILCSMKNVSKSFGGHLLFTNLDLEVQEHAKIGLVGRNGTGKTTIFKLLKGMEQADSGTVSIKKQTKIAYLEQIPQARPDETGEDVLRRAFAELTAIREKLTLLETEMADMESAKLEKVLVQYGSLQEQFERLGGYESEAKLTKVAEGLKLAELLGKEFRSLSGGEKTKLGLGMVLLEEPDLLLLDEPTNHLDVGAVEWLEQFIKEYRGTVLLISHDRYFLDETVNRIMELEDGEITVYHANYSRYTEEKQKQLLLEFQAYQEQQKKIKKMREAIKRLREWANRANPPSEGLHKRARNMERALERMEKLKKPVVDQKKMDLHFEGTKRSGKRAAVIESASKSFGDRELFSGVNLEVHYRERLALVGENGSGKSTLLRMILGDEEADTGRAVIGSSVRLGYLSQQVIPDCAGSMTLIEFFREGLPITEAEARHILAKFLFYGPAVFKKMSGASGGEKMRLQLARLMQLDLNFLILDEPTNHLDIDSREVLEDAIEHFEGTVLAVSHDRYFLEKLFPKTAWLAGGNLHLFEGSYKYAKEKMNEKRPTERTALKTAAELENELLQLEMKIERILRASPLSEEIPRLERQRGELYAELESIL